MMGVYFYLQLVTPKVICTFPLICFDFILFKQSQRDTDFRFLKFHPIIAVEKCVWYRNEVLAKATRESICE